MWKKGYSHLFFQVNPYLHATRTTNSSNLNVMAAMEWHAGGDLVVVLRRSIL